MKTVRIWAVAAVAASLACSEGIDPGQLNDPDLAKGKPDLSAQSCEVFPDGAFYVGLVALCADTEDENTLFVGGRGEMDRAGLIAKLNRAGQKCSEDGKAGDAVGKLAEVRDKVLSLRAQGKIVEPDGVDLAGDAQSLIDGFDPELTATPWTCPSGNPAE